jgi:hypothetical protein
MFASSYVAVKTRIAGWARAIRDAIKELLKPSSSVSTLAAANASTKPTRRQSAGSLGIPRSAGLMPQVLDIAGGWQV